MSKKAESRWEVKIVRDTLDEATIYVSGHTRDEAEVAADKEFMDGGVLDFETIWSEFTLEISKVDPRHEVYPVHWFPDQGMICKICLRTWSGPASPPTILRIGAARRSPARGSTQASTSQPSGQGWALQREFSGDVRRPCPRRAHQANVGIVRPEEQFAHASMAK